MSMFYYVFNKMLFPFINSCAIYCHQKTSNKTFMYPQAVNKSEMSIFKALYMKILINPFISKTNLCKHGGSFHI